jgi:hypothetical protein
MGLAADAAPPLALHRALLARGLRCVTCGRSPDRSPHFHPSVLLLCEGALALAYDPFSSDQQRSRAPSAIGTERGPYEIVPQPSVVHAPTYLPRLAY